MQVFKAAFKVFTRHIVYISIYIIFLSFMGLFVAIGSAGEPSPDFVEERVDIAIIDRDNSTISAGLSDYLATHGNIVELEDSRKAMQDAMAQDYAQYILIIPEGFGADFVEGVRRDGSNADNSVDGSAGGSDGGSTATPKLETIILYSDTAANMMDGLVDDYLDTMRLYIASGTTSDQDKLVQFANAGLAESAAVTVVQQGASAPISGQWVIYMKFVSYTTMVSIIVCVGVMLTAFNKTDIRRRNLVSPVNSTSTNLQVALACVLVCLLAWAWTVALGLAVFGHSLGGVDAAVILTVALTLLALSCVGLALGFLMGSLAVNDVVVNAAGNIVSLVISFLGGVWVPLELAGPQIVAISHFVPTSYYNSTIDMLLEAQSFNSSMLPSILTNIGICLLFAVAIFAIALVAARMRIQSAGAGGNAAAARPAAA